MAVVYHVSKTGSDVNTGTKASPFITIGAAAAVAVPGDTIIVHQGVYREWIKPANGGLSDSRRITYIAAEGEKVVIKGSERIQNWELEEGTVWKAVLPNSIFGNWNPYKETVMGDWLVRPYSKPVHLGDVYLNGMSFYEAESLDQLKNPIIRNEMIDDRTGVKTPVKNPDQTKYLWYGQVDCEKTTIYANFHGVNPNDEETEINVRRSCFYPDRTGINYITVSGFEMCHAATPWAPPTADQPGLIGPNWSKGWIIENCIIHDAKCSAVSIGKEITTGHNYRTVRKDKPGYQYQLESVFAARKIGWSKETIGSHIIRNNVIYDCGQNGVVGHLGCVFSEIYGNHIYNIAMKREYYGHEIAGIKLHGAIDVQIKNNRINDCTLGIWLDWQTQGTRISKNLCYNNNRDLFIEVSHGPYMVDHNILGSDYALDDYAQGGAYIGNLIAGKIVHDKVLNRATPYHAPHSTDVTGYAMVYGGDNRFYKNIFIGGKSTDKVGTCVYNGGTTSLEEYIKAVDLKQPADLEIFEPVEQPIYAAGNVYLGGAEAFDKETERLEDKSFASDLSINEDGEKVILSIKLPDEFKDLLSPSPSTGTIPRVRIVDADFDNPDGTPLCLNTDYFNSKADEQSVSGPIIALQPGENQIKVWG